jgi:hypothetical protein
MEFLEGETLRDRLGRDGALTLAEAARVVREVASALDYTHGCDPPVVHRDLKPENLFLLRPDGRVKVLDFGIAKVAGQGQNLTQTSTALGTPQYMSPEQLKDSKAVDPATDVFTLASIAYECLTAQLAFPGEGIGGVVLAIFDGERPRPSELRGDVPPEVDAVLARAWAIDRAKRFPSAGAFAQAFSRALEAQPATPAWAQPQGAPQHAGFAYGSGAVPPTRALPAAMLAQPGASQPLPTSQVAPPVVSTRAPEPTRGSRRPLVIGATVGLLAVLAGVSITFAYRGNTAQPAPSSVHAGAVAPPLAEPVLAPEPHSPSATDPTLAPATPPPAPPSDSPSASPTPPRGAASSPFDAVRASLERPIAGCTSRFGGSRIDVEITWDGRIGYPVLARASGTPALSADLRQCVVDAVLSYGRIPPQRQGQVNRRFTFTAR